MSAGARGALFVAAMLVGCAALDEGPSGAGGDGGPGDLARDGGGGLADAGVPSIDAGAAEPSPGGPADPDRSGDFSEAPPSGVDGAGDVAGRRSCYDGADNDGEGGEDCEDPGCEGLASCCVGDGDCCGPDPAAVALGGSYVGCADAESCLRAEDVPFGEGVRGSARGIVPAGDAGGDGGFAFGAFDLSTRRVVLDAVIDPATECGVGCLETLGVGVGVAAPPSGSGQVVSASVALVYAGARDEVGLQLGDRLVRRVAREGATEWGLVLRPTGAVALTRGGVSVVEVAGAFAPGPAVGLVYGRSRNPGATAPAPVALASLGVETELCDVPGTWRERRALGQTGEAPSLARRDGETWIAWAEAGALRVAREGVEGALERLEGPVVDAAWAAGGVGDPELWPGEEGWELYFTARGADGTSEIGHAALGEGGWEVERLGIGGAAPTVAEAGDGTRVLLVRDAAAWRVYTGAGGAWAALGGSDLDVVTAPAEDEVLGGASLVVHDGAWQLHLARRRGTRWRVALYASDELVAWRPLGVGLEGDGEGFDRLGVRAVDVWAEGPRLEAVYVGDDGQGGAALGRTWRPATDQGSR